ncbi:MAG: polyhydroxyalkanoate synthesis repressor PhaR [Gammaproteobacteria bacterium]|nr:polyhydroxyalkanoate synthesis repressor PhaR [Gammaproteobacteria bacterium]
MAEQHLIKKYANRRLYDTATSKHITLDGIHELIVQGHDVKIVDDTTGEDISRLILLQIIAEREQGGRPMLDTELLTRILRAYGNPMQDMVGEFLSKSFDAFTKQQQRYEEQMRAAMAATPLETFQELTASNLKAWQAMQDAFLKNDEDKD